MPLLQLNPLQNNRSIFLFKLVLLVWLCLSTSPLFAVKNDWVNFSIYNSDKGPSFDCKKARSKQEILICDSYDVKILDLQMSRIYNHARHRGLAVKPMQRAWFKLRKKITTEEEMIVFYKRQIRKIGKLLEKERDFYDPSNLPDRYWTSKAGRNFFVTQGCTKSFNEHERLYPTEILYHHALDSESVPGYCSIPWYSSYAKKEVQHDLLQDFDPANFKFDQLPFLGCHVFEIIKDHETYRKKYKLCVRILPERLQTIFGENFKEGWDTEKTTTFSDDCRIQNRSFFGSYQVKNGVVQCPAVKSIYRQDILITDYIFRDFNHDGYMDVMLTIGHPYLNTDTNRYEMYEGGAMFLTKTRKDQYYFTRLFPEDFPYFPEPWKTDLKAKGPVGPLP